MGNGEQMVPMQPEKTTSLGISPSGWFLNCIQ